MDECISEGRNVGMRIIVDFDFPGGRKVSQSFVEVPWPHIRLYDGLVRALAKGCSGRRLASFPLQLRHRLLRPSQACHRTNDGRFPGLDSRGYKNWI